MEILEYLATISSIIMPLVIVPLFKLSATLTDIKIKIATLEQRVMNFENVCAFNQKNGGCH